MLGPERLADVETFKRLGTEEHDLEESQQGIDLTRKDVGNCKPFARSGDIRHGRALAAAQAGAPGNAG